MKNKPEQNYPMLIFKLERANNFMQSLRNKKILKQLAMLHKACSFDLR